MDSGIPFFCYGYMSNIAVSFWHVPVYFMNDF